MNPGVTVVILNWNGKHWLEQFLPSVVASTYQGMEVLVVDNGSTDDSIDFVRKTYPQVSLLELPENYGFAEGNNKAIPHIQTPYFVLLNSDVEVTPNWLEPLVDFMESHPEAAAIQPKILAQRNKEYFEYAGAAGGYMDRFGYPFCRGRIFDVVEKDEGQYQRPEPIFWATGACCFIRTEVVQKIGLFAPDFFAHMEEIDFCWRALNHGHQIYCEPASTVYHVGGGMLPQGNPRKTYLNVRNSLACLYRNLPRGKVFGRVIIRLLLDGVWGAQLLLKGEFKSIGAILRGHFHFYGRLGKLRKQRREIYSKVAPRLPLSGFWNKSIVWAHFVAGKKQWSDLPFLSKEA